MDEARIQVLVITCNSIDTIDSTIESIRNQDYSKDEIYITVVDFNSTDGTYEKLLSYDKYHFGVYQKGKCDNKRQRTALAAQVLSYFVVGGKYTFSILLNSGEVLYPNCISRCAESFISNFGCNPKMVICEADIRSANGDIIRQEPLFPEDCIIDGKKQLNTYIERGYDHYIYQMVLTFAQGKYKSNGEINEQRFWNKCVRKGNELNVLYIREPLAIVNEIFYDDELEEILHRWESLINISRVYKSRFGYGLNDDFEKLALRNLADYAVWRSSILYKANGKTKQTEDCFLMAEVLNPDICSNPKYSEMKELLYR